MTLQYYTNPAVATGQRLFIKSQFNIHLNMTLQYNTNSAVATVQRHTFHQINVLFTTNFMFIINIIANRCYVDDSNTCRDARPSSYGAPYRFFFRTKISDCQKILRPKVINILINFSPAQLVVPGLQK